MYTEFFIENWFLFAALGAIMVLLILDPLGMSGGSATAVSPMELSRLVNHEQAVLVDIRSKEEFAAGHIAKSRNIPLDEIESHSKKLEKFKKRPMVLICGSGNKTGKAATQLRKLEFDKLFQLTGGLVEWQKESLPLEKSNPTKSTSGKSKSTSGKSTSGKSTSGKSTKAKQ